MKDGKIHIPARKKQRLNDSERAVVRVSAEAYNCLVEIYNESTLSMSQVASKLIIESMDRVVYDKEDCYEN